MLNAWKSYTCNDDLTSELMNLPKADLNIEPDLRRSVATRQGGSVDISSTMVILGCRTLGLNVNHTHPGAAQMTGKIGDPPVFPQKTVNMKSFNHVSLALSWKGVTSRLFSESFLPENNEQLENGWLMERTMHD